jgi:hypothetical protein
MALTDAQKMQVKRHLGMSTVSPSLYPLTDVWLTAGQVLSTLPAETETEVIAILATLGNLESWINDAPKRLKAKKIGSIDLQPDELPKLWTEVRRWRNELSVLTGLPNLRATRSLPVI